MVESPPVSPAGLRKEGSNGWARDRKALAAESAPSSMNFFRSMVHSWSEFRPCLVSEETELDHVWFQRRLKPLFLNLGFPFPLIISGLSYKKEDWIVGR